MNFLRNLAEALNGTMETPKTFGWFHIMCFAIMIAICAVIIIFRKRISQKAVNITLIVTGAVFILLELYKQLVMTYDSNGLTEVLWYIFPFQFCSTPMYLAVIAGILRKGKVYECLTSYLASFGLIAGTLVMIIPGNVFIETIGINIQTMIVHGGMVVIGVLLWATKTVEANWKTLLKAGIIFAIMSSIAYIMNVIWHFTGPVDEHSFNMFYISMWDESALPVLQDIQKVVPHIVFLLIYLIGFVLCAAIVIYFVKLIHIISAKIKAKKNA